MNNMQSVVEKTSIMNIYCLNYLNYEENLIVDQLWFPLKATKQ